MQRFILILLTIILLQSAFSFLKAAALAEQNDADSLAETSFEALPILSYDTDVGFGYGAKAFLLNSIDLNESFDLILFNSTKGERFYKLVFSLPDFELRQGKIFPLALDVTLEYDKLIKNSFFGIGNRSLFSDREYFTREPFGVSIAVSRGFSQTFVGQLGIKYMSVRNFNFSNSSKLEKTEPVENSGKVKYSSIFVNVRYDTRNSFINPSRGLVLQAETEIVPKIDFNNVDYTRIGFTFQHYSVLFYPKTILALRFGMQNLIGDELPIQTLLSVGGNNTLRGFPQDRFLDKISAVGNVELRFPIYWRFGGVFGLDAGKVWHKLNQFDLTNWAWNTNIGLRFYFDTFIVRLDVGFSKETTGFYLNFGQIF